LRGYGAKFTRFSLLEVNAGRVYCGEGVLIWSSRDRHSGEMRWNRVWRRIR